MHAARAVLASLIAGFFFQSATAQTLMVVENQATMSPAFETSPRLGHDGTGDLVVYTSRDLLNTGDFTQGDIYYQRLVAGQPFGPPVQVTRSLTDDKLNDVSGDYIVYTAYDDVYVESGSIMLYRISTGQLRALGSSMIIQEPRIFGDKVVWRQGGSDVAEVVLYNLATNTSDVIGGPAPAAFDVDIGDKWVVWSSRTSTTSDYDIEVFNLATMEQFAITNTSTIDERTPATSGDWVVWAEPSADLRSGKIVAQNMSTWEVRVIVDDGAMHRWPRIDGDLITWEGNPNGDFDVFVYRISTGEIFRVTFIAGPQYLNDNHGNLVAYVDLRNGTDEDIYVASLQFCTDRSPAIAPAMLNFGEVRIGESSSLIVTITNSDASGYLSLSSIGLGAGGSTDFAITSLPALPVRLAPNETVDVQITYTPMIEGQADASLVMSGACGALGYSFGSPITGTGVRARVPPTQQVTNIIDFVDTAVAGGTLVGSGSGNSATGRLGALRNMLEAAGTMIASGLYAEACVQLQDALNRTDGAPRPPDFVAGPAAATLAAMIRALRADLGCP